MTLSIQDFIHFKRLFQGTTVKNFFKKMFGQPVRIRVIAFIIALEVSLNILAGLFTAFYDKSSFTAQWNITLPIVVNAAVMSILTGAGGGECGWRGFLLPHFMRKKGLLTSCIMIGIIWGFWNLPLWLLSGYTGTGLLLYIVQFMICVVNWSIIIGILYLWNNNLVIPILFHFLVNFLMYFFTGNDFLYQVTLTVLYIITAVVFSIVYTRNKNLFRGDNNA